MTRGPRRGTVRIVKLPALLLPLLLAACGDEASTCKGTLSGPIERTFDCSFQASYMNQSVVTLSSAPAPEGVADVSIALRVSTIVTARTYELDDLQSLTGTMEILGKGVYQVLKMPPQGTGRMTLTEVDASESTNQEANYGLAGSVDATMVDATGLTAETATLRYEF